MALFGKKRNAGGFMDEIRCDEVDYLIWKWHPYNSVGGNNTRENAIRWGSSLRVKDGEVAVFVYRQKDGTMQDFIEGPFDETLKTANLPVIARIIGLAYEGGTPFQAEVYFINLAQIIQLKFAVPYFDVFDPRFSDFGVPVSVRGTISFSITDYYEFIGLHRLSQFDINDFEKQIRDAVSRYVKSAVMNAPKNYGIPVVQIESRIAQINNDVEHEICERLHKDFGVTVSGVDLGVIEVDQTSLGYSQLMSVTKDVVGAVTEAEAEAKVRDIITKQQIDAENYAEIQRIQREEAQYAQRMQTRTNNMMAYQIEKQSEVGVAGAEAIGKMGENGGGSIGFGNNGSFNPAAVMTSMAVGGAIGQNIASIMNGSLSGMNKTTGETVPPPIPVVDYHCVIDGQAMGPYDIGAMSTMIASGQISAKTLVWKAGMPQWVEAGSEEKLKLMFTTPPIPPTGA